MATNDVETFHIKVTMQKRWIPHFMGLLSYMQEMGSIGSSRMAHFLCDGDGDFRPKFLYDFIDRDKGYDLEIAEPISIEKEEPWFDAG
ncbi:MAG: hypothetical protein DRI46_13365 [Chloroflexi bacterium]|nr:MAG: hypothetical protein DRI46_13365 [Chloroflexota bacterium]